MKVNREDVVKAALTIEHWCEENQDEYGNCDCPFAQDIGKNMGLCKLNNHPSDWCLETFLRTRGIKQ